MTLPQLYSDVSLRSYDYIRQSKRDGRPEGCGMASPFTMGLNGLVSRNVAGYVKNFEVCGEWKEFELQELAEVGRVPDGSMMLMTLVRVAIEKMAVLNSFRYVYLELVGSLTLTICSWKLNMKMLPTVWQGLSQKSSLTRLTVKFPSERHPRPIALVPPIPNLQYLYIYDIDPLCYIDDISLLFLESKKLRDLKMHWNPRIREAREPSIMPDTYFGRCATAHYPMPLRSLAVQNLYSRHSSNCGETLDLSGIEEITFLNSSGGMNDGGAAAFLENTSWRKPREVFPANLKMLRMDKISHEQCEFLSSVRGVEKLFLVGPHSRLSNSGNGTKPYPHSPTSSTSSPSSGNETSSLPSLKDSYLNAIVHSHGPTLTHLLLLPQWRLTDDNIALIVRQCPNLQELGMGTDCAKFGHVVRLLIPFLSKLTSFRLLGNPDDATFENKIRELEERGLQEDRIREESPLRWVEFGGDEVIFEIGKRSVSDGCEGGESRSESSDGGNVERPTQTWRRPMLKRSRESVQHIDIWRMDSYDLEV